MTSQLPSIVEHRRFRSPAVTPQALAWHDGNLWLGSRDLRRVYGIDVDDWRVFEEREAPGIPWAAVSTGKELRMTIGEGENDDRYMWSYTPGKGFSDHGRFAYPDFTGSYVSFDGSNLYMSQWYKARILQLASDGQVVRTVQIPGEISGHVFVDGAFYVLRGTEKEGESWTIAKFDPGTDRPEVRDLAVVPFACRSLTYDGRHFWSNFRAGGETISFSLPD
ncbi:MAG TPA: hypothetical protein VJ719_04305 [Chthoniobacterales bacterium]|nr:hypothetical protein [Chthoniobacterales bacterium]